MPGAPIAQDDETPRAPIETRADTRRTWFRRLGDDVVAVRTPLIAIGAYCIIVLVPDQTADSIRTMFEESIGWFLIILACWFFMSLYLVMTLMATALLGFKRADRLAGHTSGSTLSVQRRILFWIVTLAIPTVTTISLVASYAPSFAFSNVPVSIYIFSFFLFTISLFFFQFIDIDNTDLGEGPLIGSAILCLGVLLFTHIFAIRDLPPLLMITTWIVVVLAVLEIIERLSAYWGFPILTILLICFVAFSILDWNDNHEIRKLNVEASSPPPPVVGAAFDSWLEARQIEIAKYKNIKKQYPVFLIAAEGGGIRAASMAALVLEKLRTACPDALRHTFLTIGVSGGSLGATLAHAAAKREGLESGCRGPMEDNIGPVSAATKVASDDLLRPLLLGTLFVDLPSQIAPLRVLPSYVTQATDRARYLESGISSAFQRYAHNSTYFDLLKARWLPTTLELDSIRFRSMWAGPSGSVPALMLLATEVNSGRRVAVSHVLMPPLPSSGADPCRLLDSADQNRSSGARTRVVSLAELLPNRDVSASTAAILSARFPGVTPAASVSCDDVKLRLVDGGYFENSGLTTAIEVTREILPKAIAQGASIYIISIENGDASPDWRYARGLPSAGPSEYFSEALSPFRAMEGSRQAHADLAHASLESSSAAPMARIARTVHVYPKSAFGCAAAKHQSHSDGRYRKPPVQKFGDSFSIHHLTALEIAWACSAVKEQQQLRSVRFFRWSRRAIKPTDYTLPLLSSVAPSPCLAKIIFRPACTPVFN
jgi:hypothetical protein